MRMKGKDDPLYLENLRLTPQMVAERKIEPRKVRKRRKHFVQVPWIWIEKLHGATGHTHQIALRLLYQDWRQKQWEGGPVKLPNGMLEYDGISQPSKWRALIDLEKRGLVTVERRPRKSPLVHINPFKDE
jgi:hypothetical protein